MFPLVYIFKFAPSKKKRRGHIYTCIITYILKSHHSHMITQRTRAAGIRFGSNFCLKIDQFDLAELILRFFRRGDMRERFKIIPFLQPITSK